MHFVMKYMYFPTFLLGFWGFVMSGIIYTNIHLIAVPGRNSSVFL